MGIGNLTELTDADTTGITAVLMGIVSELHIRNVLVVQVSPHCRRAVRESRPRPPHPVSARAEQGLPQGMAPGCCACATAGPFPTRRRRSPRLAAQVSDDNFRIEVAADGIHVYNRAATTSPPTPSSFFPGSASRATAAHAFYLGVELARAEIAWQLGKRYVQDQPLGWGCAVDRAAGGHTRHLKAAGAHPGGQGAGARERLMPMIRETIVTTHQCGRQVHIAPLGLIPETATCWSSPRSARPRPWRICAPSRTPCANYADDVRVFAGCLTGRRDWPARPRPRCPGPCWRRRWRMPSWRSSSVDEDAQRPRFRCRVVHRGDACAVPRLQSRPGGGGRGGDPGRAASICCRREKIEREIAYLQIAIDKTAGPREREAWRLIIKKIEEHFEASPKAGA